MNSFDIAVDEYLHLIARVCPWDLPREEPLLTAFCAWLGERPAAQSDLDALSPEAADEYAEQSALTQEQYEALLGALSGLYRWAMRDGRTVSNPFAGAYEQTRATLRALFADAATPA